MSASTCALCGKPGELWESPWGRVHEDCGYRKGAEERSAKVTAYLQAKARVLETQRDARVALDEGVRLWRELSEEEQAEALWALEAAAKVSP